MLECQFQFVAMNYNGLSLFLSSLRDCCKQFNIENDICYQMPYDILYVCFINVCVFDNVSCFLLEQ